MEYIHKAKAEKTRTKILSDQMEARRVKNKASIVVTSPSLFRSLTQYFLSRLLVSAGRHVSLRSVKALLLLRMRRHSSNGRSISLIVPSSPPCLWARAISPALHPVHRTYVVTHDRCILHALFFLDETTPGLMHFFCYSAISIVSPLPQNLPA
jgi:hypothetical protein